MVSCVVPLPVIRQMSFAVEAAMVYITLGIFGLAVNPFDSDLFVYSCSFLKACSFERKQCQSQSQ